jgi:CheY-like chemotaxis protein
MKKVMIVDDSMFMRQVLRDLLPDTCDVVEADSALTAVELFQAERPDLVLLDIIMPGEDQAGISVLKTLMEIDPDVQVVMITALGQDVIVEQCKKLGIREYITKPFDDKIVGETIERCLGHVVQRT